jgi:hypothetical protein
VTPSPLAVASRIGTNERFEPKRPVLTASHSRLVGLGVEAGTAGLWAGGRITDLTDLVLAGPVQGPALPGGYVVQGGYAVGFPAE